MSQQTEQRSGAAQAAVWLAVGLLALAAAWALPVNLGSVTLPLLRKAGAGTPDLAAVGQEWVQSEKIGPATLLLDAAEAIHDPGAPALRASIASLAAKQSELVAWGGWDPYLDPVLKLKRPGGAPSVSTPVIDFLVPEDARDALRSYLANSRSLGVQSLLKLEDLNQTGRFAPAKEPGGQPLDTLILLSALLYQGDHFSPALQRQVRAMTDTALRQNQLGDLEGVFLDLLSLARRLDWVQLCELLNRTEDTKTVGEYAHLARVAPHELPLIYAAALYSSSADRVAAYLLHYGKSGLADLRTAMGLGRGAARLLVERQLPINRSPVAGLSEAASLGILYPRLSLVLRWLGFLVGAFALLKGLDRLLFRAQPGFGPALPHAKSGVLALLIGALFALATEPYLLKAAPISEFKAHLLIPALTAQPPSVTQHATTSPLAMDSSTLLSIAIFAALQVVMYLICLLKIREIGRQDMSPALKLRLMENEENLFDSGLYIGIAGTATALVLQVLRIIEPNLLAAYSSNLFGITCVALVKIRHVRPYKRTLILESQGAALQAQPAK